jgi:HK97 family phage major capsid protein
MPYVETIPFSRTTGVATMPATDAMIARLEAELEERNAFIEGLVGAAHDANRDLSSQDMKMITGARTRISELAGQLNPLRETSRLSIESRRRAIEIDAELQGHRRASAVEYRSAGAYIADLYYGQLGDREAQQRMEVFNRAAAHQTTADNPGLLPENIVAPVINYISVARPICSTLGPTDLGGGAWSYARVTQHTSVAKQAGEKTELASRKMTVTKTALGADTFGGYVNVSKQDINRSSPSILDMVIADLAEQYAIATELEAATVLTGAATAGPVIPTGPATPSVVAGAIWTAAGSVYAATAGQGRTVVAVAPDMLGVIGPIFPPVNPTNAYSSGFSLPITQGDNGSIAGLSVIMSAGLAAGTILVYSTAAAKAFEYKYGNLQVVEPSVWGVQVGYAGDFDCVVINAAGVVSVTKTP